MRAEGATDLAGWLAANLGVDRVDVGPIQGPALTGFSKETLLFDARYTRRGRAVTEGLVVRVTAKGKTQEEAEALVAAEEAELRTILGDLVFGVDDETMAGAPGTMLLGDRKDLASPDGEADAV